MSKPAESHQPATSEPAGRAPVRPFSLLVERFCRWAFASISIAPGAVDHVNSLTEQGSVVYVMRQRSWVDYTLVTYVLMREGLPPPEFANDMSCLWLRPLRVVLAGTWRRLRDLRIFARELRAFEDRDRCQRLVGEGRPVLVFMRGRVPRMRLFTGRRRGLGGLRAGSDYVREIVHHRWASGQPVSFVPIAVLRGRGMRRKESRLATLVYSVQEMPSEIRRFISLMWNLRETSISVGAEVQLREFMRQYHREGEERIVRRLTRALQIFLYREERMVWGPLLLSKRQVRQQSLQDEEVSSVIRRLAAERGQPESQVWRQAERYFDEMAANFHGIYFSILELAFNLIWPRLFHGLEYSGLEKVSECVKRHPVVLVPCHRSHFDYLILSYVFHINYLSPPHIAAGINLSFWPLGPLFRGAGAYFIRRSFEGDDLYKIVFRKYLTYLIREGYTQEFFIEGGRSRTGKILPPKLGMLSAIVDAFAEGVRRDLYFVPVSIHYGRVVEEEAYERELGGAEKQQESLAGLLRARAVFRQRYGTVYLTFADPISLSRALGPLREEFRHAVGGEAQERKRRFVRKLGFHLLREVNNASVAGATSVSATVLLNAPHPACRHGDFLIRAQALFRFLRDRRVRMTASLERNAKAEFRENLTFLENAGLIQRLPGERGGVIHVPGAKRRALNFYKNNTIHFFLLPALLTEGLSRGLCGAALQDEVIWWLDLFRWEFALPERDELGKELGKELGRLGEYLRAEAVLTESDQGGFATDHPFVASVSGLLDSLRESYWVAAQVLMGLPEGGVSQQALIERMQRQFKTALLLGEVRKPEGNCSVTLRNGLSRFVELDSIRIHPGKGRDRVVTRGPRFSELTTIAERIGREVLKL